MFLSFPCTNLCQTSITTNLSSQPKSCEVPSSIHWSKKNHKFPILWFRKAFIQPPSIRPVVRNGATLRLFFFVASLVKSAGGLTAGSKGRKGSDLHGSIRYGIYGSHGSQNIKQNISIGKRETYIYIRIWIYRIHRFYGSNNVHLSYILLFIADEIPPRSRKGIRNSLLTRPPEIWWWGKDMFSRGTLFSSANC